LGYEEKKLAWITWETIFKSRKSGGLGIKDLACFNKILLGKWKWRLGKGDKELWWDIIMSKYESWKSFDSNNEKPSESRWLERSENDMK